jgi:glyoxylase-like metal-dependent hydrolase (beta-lactamase superfamily II)
VGVVVEAVRPTRAAQTLLLDLAGNRTRVDMSSEGGGFESRTTLVVQNGRGVSYNQRAMTSQAIPRIPPERLASNARLLPNLLLRQVLAASSSLRYVGPAKFEGRPHDVISFASPDSQKIALYFDGRSGLLSKFETTSGSPELGSQASEVIFSDYVTVGAHRVPKTSLRREGGILVARSRLSAEFDPSDIDTDFTVDDARYTQPKRVPQDFSPRVERLADGVIVLHNIAGVNYNTMAVAFKDYVVAVEAPGTSDGSDKVIARIKQEFPGKPIRYVVVTHHHGDHVSGIRSYIAEGATVIATRANREVIEALAAEQRKDRLDSLPRKPEYLFADGAKRVITDGEQTLELLQVGPHPHADEMLIAHVPTARALFQADMFFAPTTEGPPSPRFSGELAFAKRLGELGLKLDHVASVHGRTVSYAEFVRAFGGGDSTG